MNDTTQHRNHQPDNTTPIDADVSTRLGGRISAPMIAALEQAWADIRARHPEVPAAVVVLGAGSIGAPAAGLRLGHFAAMRWHHEGRAAAGGVRRR